MAKKGFKKMLVKGTKIFQKKKKTKRENMVVNYIEIFLKMKNEERRLAEYRKNYSKMQKIKTGWLFY